MSEDSDLRELWQSQPFGPTLDARVPQLGLLEDLTVPVFAPLSPWRRVSYAIWAVNLASLYWRNGSASGWLHSASGWTALLLGGAGALRALIQRDRTHDPQLEENIQSYRTALVAEFERQFRLERWILILLCGASAVSSALWAAAEVLERHPPEYVELAGPVVVVGFILWGRSMYRRAANAVRARLRSEAGIGFD